jgi:hypothetical protein
LKDFSTHGPENTFALLMPLWQVHQLFMNPPFQPKFQASPLQVLSNSSPSLLSQQPHLIKHLMTFNPLKDFINPTHISYPESIAVLIDAIV